MANYVLMKKNVNFWHASHICNDTSFHEFSENSSQKQFCVKFEYLNFLAKNDVEYLRKDRISSTPTRHFWQEIYCYRVHLIISKSHENRKKIVKNLRFLMVSFGK